MEAEIEKAVLRESRSEAHKFLARIKACEERGFRVKGQFTVEDIEWFEKHGSRKDIDNLIKNLELNRRRRKARLAIYKDMEEREKAEQKKEIPICLISTPIQKNTNLYL